MKEESNFKEKNAQKKFNHFDNAKNIIREWPSWKKDLAENENVKNNKLLEVNMIIFEKIKRFFVKLYKRIQRLLGITPKSTITKDEFDALSDNEWVKGAANIIEKEEDKRIIKKLQASIQHIKEFEGNNIEDSHQNIEKYLKELMAHINKPIKDCPHCKGMGVLIK